MNNLAEIKKTLSQNKYYLVEKFNIDELAVFGSYSRGDENSESDIDIMVSFKKPIGLEFVDLSIELEKILNHKIDLVSKNAIKPRMMKKISDELIYV